MKFFLIWSGIFISNVLALLAFMGMVAWKVTEYFFWRMSPVSSEVTTLVIFGFSSIFLSLLLEGRYRLGICLLWNFIATFAGVVTFGALR